MVPPFYCEAENIESSIREIQKLERNLLIAIVDYSSPSGTGARVTKDQARSSECEVKIPDQVFNVNQPIFSQFSPKCRGHMSQILNYIRTLGEKQW